uniref:Beta-lactamase-related domain-containing protein n=2 Tax=Parascaris univalens TaxID=6257 RepID=A0A915CJS5_PARUN
RIKLRWKMNLYRLIAPLSIAGITLGYGGNQLRLEYAEHKRLIKKRSKASRIIQRFLVRTGAPGLSIGVSMNGDHVWSAGFGLADVEQMVPCSADTVMRIASISKSITATIAARLVEKGKLNLDSTVQEYLPDYPKKEFDGKPVDITIRQLLCHTSGIRHYKKDDGDEIEFDENNNAKRALRRSEFLNKKSYRSVDEALEMFKDDSLIAEPGSSFHYTTHGYTLLSAILEKAAALPFRTQIRQLFRELGMNHSLLDDNRQIISNRTRYYYRDRQHKLKNAPEVDNSYKWAGGGVLSTVDDLLIFANSMLYSFHYSLNVNVDNKSAEPLVKPEVLKIFWQGEVDGTHGFRYGLGWYKSEMKPVIGGGDGWTRHGFWLHTGAAIGASSILLVKPNFEGTHLDGICIAILVNLHNCGELTSLALEIAEIFQR